MTTAGRIVVRAGRLLTTSGTWRHDVALAFEHGRVVAIERPHALETWDGAAHLGGERTIVLPGLINAHQHGRALSSVGLGVRDDTLEPWAADLLGAAWSTPYEETRALCRKLAVAGTTSTVHVHSTGAGAIDVYEHELREILRAYADVGIAVTLVADLRDGGIPVYADPARFLAKLPEDLRLALEAAIVAPPGAAEAIAAIRRVRADTGERSDVALGPVAQQWCSPALMSAVARAAAQDGLRVHTHLLQTPIDRALGRRRDARGAVGELVRLGLVTSRLSVAHGVLLDDTDCAALARGGTSVVVNPSSCLRVLRGMAPLRVLRTHGVTVALGTDSMNLSGREDLFEEARLLSGLARFDGRADPVGAGELLTMLTTGGAAVLGPRGAGRLEVGSWADAILLDADQLGPAVDRADLAELLIAAAGPAAITDVVAGGHVLVRGGACLVPTVEATYSEPDEQRLELLRRLRPHVAAHYAAWAGQSAEESSS